MGILVNDGNSKPVNLSAYAVAMPVAKHGSHDQASHGSWAGNGAPGGESDMASGKATKVGWERLGMTSKMGEVETTPGVLDKLFGKGEKVEGDEFERKVTESWVFEMENPATGKKFVAEVYDWMRYEREGKSVRQSFRMGPMKRTEKAPFSVGAESREDAKFVEDYIASNSGN